MAPNTPVDALGPHYDTVRDSLVEAIRTKTDQMIDAHQASGTGYTTLFGTQWRDLLDVSRGALKSKGFGEHKVAPAGYKLPVVNGSLIYVWRVSNGADAIANFASSPTRFNTFVAPLPPTTLFEGTVVPDVEAMTAAPDSREMAGLRAAAQDSMPLVLVMVLSTPRGLNAIEWAVATLNSDGKVVLHGQESIWSPELVSVSAATDVESFDSGVPAKPTVSIQTQSRSSDG